MKTHILLVLFHALLPAAAQSAMFKGGTYALTEVFDEKDEPVQLPVGRFDLVVAPAEGGGTPAGAESEATRYRFNLKIGNMLGGSFELSNTDNNKFLKMGPMRSTMMMPPQDVYALEIRLNKLLPAVTDFQLEGGKIVFRGSEGSASFKELFEESN